MFPCRSLSLVLTTFLYLALYKSRGWNFNCESENLYVCVHVCVGTVEESGHLYTPPPLDFRVAVANVFFNSWYTIGLRVDKAQGLLEWGSHPSVPLLKKLAFPKLLWHSYRPFVTVAHRSKHTHLHSGAQMCRGTQVENGCFRSSCQRALPECE